MKHVVTITVDDLRDNNYVDNHNCPLAVALKRHFPEASEVYVSADFFQFDHLTLGFVHRRMDKCEVMTFHETDFKVYDNRDLENLLSDMSRDDDFEYCQPQEITFNFITP